MYTPSPPPSPAAPPLRAWTASLFEHPSANEPLDHVTYPGSAVNLSRPASSQSNERVPSPHFIEGANPTSLPNLAVRNEAQHLLGSATATQDDGANIEPSGIADNEDSLEAALSVDGPQLLSPLIGDTEMQAFPNIMPINLGGNHHSNMTSMIDIDQYATANDHGATSSQYVDTMENGASFVNWYTPHSQMPILDYASATALFPQQGLASTINQSNAVFQHQYTMPAQITLQSQLPAMTTGMNSYHLPTFIPMAQRTPCSFCAETFARPGDLDRHWQSVHLGIKHNCFWPGCHNNRGKGYCRLEKLRTHQKEKHGLFTWV